MRLEWSLFALSDRETIFDYIEAENLKAAAAVDNFIEESVKTLATSPEIGRPGNEMDSSSKQSDVPLF